MNNNKEKREQIEQIIMMEKVAVPSFVKSIRESVNLSGLSRGAKNLIIAHMRLLERDARMHRHVLNKLKNRFN